MQLSKQELNKTWLLTGACGQDSSLMFDLLLEKGYTNIHGTMRRSATFNTQNIDHIFDKLKLHYCDLTDSMNIHNIIAKVRPDYIVHMAAMSHVKVSHELENYTFQTNTLGTLSILQSVRSLGLEKTCKIYHASTSEQFGNTSDGSVMLNEDSLMKPVSIYGISKKASQEICNMYRDAYGMFVVSSILFNHEGSRRGHTFVTQKIANYVAKYYDTCNKFRGDNQSSFPLHPLQLGNLNARRDWGSAKLYMNGVFLMLQQEKPDNYVIATGETHSVREFVELAFKEIGIDMEWIGTGVDEVGVEKNNKKRILVQVNPNYYRDIDIECLIGDASKAKKELGWTYDLEFKDLVNEMVVAAINRIGYWDLGTPYVSLDVKKL
jgi:GDPmannose 4,6-dehydratase